MSNPNYPEGVTVKDIDRIGEPKDVSCCDNGYLIKYLTETLEFAYKIMEDIEWEYRDESEIPSCPFCKGEKPNHYHKCMIKKFLDDRGKL